MIAAERVEEICREHLSGSPLFLLDVKVSPGNRILVRVDADQGVRIDDCRELHRKIEATLDRDVEDFELEVSSAGLEEPFVVQRQYIKNVGRVVEVLLQNGKKKKGILSAADEQGIEIEEKPKWKNDPVIRHRFEYPEIKQTKKTITFK
ncbi:MAG: ribosome assembly cofactor RimP [Bacteroidia bacterium]|nr:ribosome assembly cofactor RimP [Bacteroidia bacterium]